MTLFAAAQSALITEVEQAIERISPDIESKKPFQRYKGRAATMGSLEKALIGPRQFSIGTGRRVGWHGVGRGYQFPLFEYDITVQYPPGDVWSRTMHSDAMLIHYKLLNTPTSVDGVQARWIMPASPIEAATDDANEKQTITMVLSVYYETTDTA